MWTAWLTGGASRSLEKAWVSQERQGPGKNNFPAYNEVDQKKPVNCEPAINAIICTNMQHSWRGQLECFDVLVARVHTIGHSRETMSY